MKNALPTGEVVAMGCGEMKKGLLLLAFIGGLTACGPKEFHDQQDYVSSNDAIPGTESKITNHLSTMPGSFIANNSVALVLNFNVKTREYFGFCSGTRLTPQLILTAAHCIQRLETMRAVFGTNIHHAISSRENIFEIENVIVHDKYKTSQFGYERRLYDIALVKLKARSNLPQTEGRILEQFYQPLTTVQYLNQNQDMNLETTSKLLPTIAGYGVAFHKNPSKELARIVGSLNEAAIHLKIEDYAHRIISLSSHSLSQACLGDSGGPMFVWRGDHYYLQAVAISIKDTENADPFTKTLCKKESSYLNLDFFKTWIMEKSKELQ